MKKILKTPYGEYEVKSLGFKQKRMTDGSLHNELILWGETEDGPESIMEPIMVATKYAPTAFLSEDEMLVKDYSENEGCLEFLIQNGICSKPKRWIRSGFVDLALVDILKRTLD